MSGQPILAQPNGFLNLYKPSGCTSMDLVRQVKRLTGQRKKVGHGGTLDPLAEGVLPICFGQATRLMEYLVENTKGYRTTVHLGISTDTYDAEGQVVDSQDSSGLTEGDILRALEQFRGTILQVPPMYSAIKMQGRRLYDLARSGVVVEREPRKVRIERLELIRFDPPYVELDVQCGRGVYLRSLAQDLGEALGCGGHLKWLLRSLSGPFVLDQAISIDTLRDAATRGSWRELLLPADFLVRHLNSFTVSKAGERLIHNGQPIKLNHDQALSAGYLESFRAYTTEGCFLAILRLDRAGGRWLPYKVFNLSEPSPYSPDGGPTS